MSDTHQTETPVGAGQGPVAVQLKTAIGKKDTRGTQRLMHYFARYKILALLLAISSLSGGNQQKAVLTKMLLPDPKILILDEPTRGVDVGAKYEIYKLIFELVRRGISIIMVSSELPEILGISDRVLVIGEGQLRGDFINQDLSQEQILAAAIKQPAMAACA